MSATQKKRLEMLEQALSERYASDWATLNALLETMIEAIFKGSTDEEVQAMHTLELDPLNPFVMWVRSLGATTYDDSYLSEVNAWTEQIILLLRDDNSPTDPVPPLPAFDARPALESIALLEQNADRGPNPEGTRFHVRTVRAHLAFLEAVGQRWADG